MSSLYAGFMSTDSLYEVQRTNNFRIVFDQTVDPNGYIELACDSAGLPTTSNDPIELSYGNSKVKVAGQANVDDVSVAVKDFIEADIEKILYDWRLKVYNPENGKVGWASNYKKDATIVQYGPNGEVLRKWQLKGVWPTSLDLGEMNYDGGDKKQITMNLSVDNAILVRDQGGTITSNKGTED